MNLLNGIRGFLVTVHKSCPTHFSCFPGPWLLSEQQNQTQKWKFSVDDLQKEGKKVIKIGFSVLFPFLAAGVARAALVTAFGLGFLRVISK